MIKNAPTVPYAQIMHQVVKIKCVFVARLIIVPAAYQMGYRNALPAIRAISFKIGHASFAKPDAEHVITITNARVVFQDINLEGRYCYKCSDNCIDCDKYGDCNICRPGFFTGVDPDCYKCDTGCTKCVSSSNCSVCSGGFELIKTACKACPIGCKTCSNGSCTKCNYSYALKDGQCTQCPSNCGKCTTEGSCTACQDGNFLKNGMCVSCGDNCMDCKSENTCRLCKERYDIQSGKCILNECNNVNKCTDKQFCGIDPTGNKCVHLSKNCLEADISGKCIKCTAPYVAEDGKCASCAEHCKTCISSKQCTECYDYYFLKTGVCTTCSDGCRVCDSPTKCTKCGNGYQMDGNICQKQGPHDCSSPSSKSKPCPSGKFCLYYPWISTCETCVEGCSACSDIKSCTACIDGYMLSEQACVKQICAQSKQCESGSFCEMKSTGNTCRSCLKGCATCTDSSTCRQCAKGHFSSRGVCAPCGQNCKSCQDQDLCYACQDGAEMVDGLCAQQVQRMSGGSIAGIVVGLVLLVGLIGGAIAFAVARKRKAQRSVQGDLEVKKENLQLQVDDDSLWSKVSK
uniref:Cysteine-rich membrane protein 2 n=1 Tax=Spironucleus salmonicida TaxID=348837 RepID=V6LQB0_9EUKA|eukprot:EST45896.1 Cysteine-rich membrane protein 2 [Spironucleus salmonicida]